MKLKVIVQLGLIGTIASAQLAHWPTPPIQTTSESMCGWQCSPIGSDSCDGQMGCFPRYNGDDAQGICMDSPWAKEVYNFPLGCSIGDGYVDPETFPPSCVSSNSITYQGVDCNAGDGADEAQRASLCCFPGHSYKGYTCSPPVDKTHGTLAVMTNNDFTDGGAGGGIGSCIKDGIWPQKDEKVVALSTGSVGSTEGLDVVDECDSQNGCDVDHSGQRPCKVNVVDASSAVCEELGCDPSINQYITWSDKLIDPNGGGSSGNTGGGNTGGSNTGGTTGGTTGGSTGGNTGGGSGGNGGGNANPTCSGSASSVSDLAFQPTVQTSGNSFILTQSQAHGQTFTVSAVSGCGPYADGTSIPAAGLSNACGFSITVPSGCEIQVVSSYKQFSNTGNYKLSFASGDAFVGASIKGGSAPSTTPFGGTFEVDSLSVGDNGIFTVGFTSVLKDTTKVYEVAVCVGASGVTNTDCTASNVVLTPNLVSGKLYKYSSNSPLDCSKKVVLTLSAYEIAADASLSSPLTSTVSSYGCGVSNVFKVSPTFGSITVASVDGSQNANQDITFTLPTNIEVWINALSVSPGCSNADPSLCKYVTIPSSCFSQTSSSSSATVTIFAGSTGSLQPVTSINSCQGLKDLRFVDSNDSLYEFDIHWTTQNPGSSSNGNGGTGSNGGSGGSSGSGGKVLMHIHESARLMEPGMYHVEGNHVTKVQARFDLDGVPARWVMWKIIMSEGVKKWWNFPGVGGASSSAAPGSESGRDEENVGRHEFQLLMRKGEWVTVAYAEVDRKPFFKYTLAESAPGKGESHDPRPIFGKIEFVMDKLCWLNCEQGQVLVILSSLLQVWLGDVLNKEGRLEHVLAERMKKFRNPYNQTLGSGYLQL
ncbi:hypothetical protein BCR33DRAFT_781883 [Rhizoclosmatium globosum]|uniref:Uncharacterized protein n=1 Tax=Rhizoclosmatium globosum TaxID=329046 RepID=A0A1Y2CP95_9FUNG|nr:hypothetical protein BCR33DRAFT_781883 [Rhizoclosmatium globosum]|eukprot:ORY48860.1 hypothetical protein BCR33DRAFT_781883 [Rhizoclosmatium globosum]